jgi:hypothetical protein
VSLVTLSIEQNTVCPKCLKGFDGDGRHQKRRKKNISEFLKLKAEFRGGESRGEKLSGRGISVHDGELFYRNYSRMEKLAHRL